MGNINIQNILKSIPSLPWIYQFFNEKNEIIYIGKSSSLKNRVSSYFNGTSKLNFAKKKMVSEIKNIEYIITNTETESLLLESTLIKKSQPKYNILMKDDKNYLYIKITNEAIPKIITTRIKTKDGYFFGPYTSGNHVKNILKILKKIYGYRSCNITFIQKWDTIEMHNTKGKVPCIDYYIKRCSAPCLLEKDKEEKYKNAIESIKNFLGWDFKSTIKTLEIEMLHHAKKMEFEKAKELKDTIISIQSLEESQIVRDFVDGNYNIINYIKKYNWFYIWVIEIRDSKITGYRNIEVENKLEESDEEILEVFLENTFLENEKIKYILPTPLQNTFFKDKIEVPKIWAKLDMLKLCYKNIYEYAYKKYIDSLSSKSFTKSTQKNILQKLWYKAINQNIIFECNDISHLSGTHTVASRSVIENGKTNPSLYKKFTIKTLEHNKIDDFESMREIMTRRLKELILKKNIPDLIIIDGGKGQLSSVLEIIENFKKEYPEEELLSKLQLVSLAKREEELFLPHEKESIILEKGCEELRLIQKIRDEAHRFAITFNRDKRISVMKKNILESLPGFGPVARKKLLKEFWSVENIRNINKEDLSKILNKAQIETLENHWLLWDFE